MKVAINSLVVDDQKTGVGYYAYNLVSTLICRDNISYNAEVYSQQEIYREVSKKADNNISFKEVNNFKTNKSRIIYEQLIMPLKYKKGNYDLIHCLDYQSPFFSLGQRFIITIHDLSYFLFDDIFTKGQSFYKKVNTSKGVKIAKGIITDAQNTKKDILRLFPNIDERKIAVIPLAANPIFERKIDLQEEKRVKEEYGITDDYLLYVGTLEPRKNISLLIESFQEVLSRRGNGLKLVIVGRKGWMYEQIFEKIKRLDMQKNVVFTGYVPEEKLPYLYSGAKIFVYPSIYEGFGLPPLEAMHCGTPVICSNTSSLPEVVGDAGYLIDPYKKGELTESIIMLLENDNLRQRLIEKGKKRAKVFNWERTADLTLKFYEKIYSQNRQIQMKT